MALEYLSCIGECRRAVGSPALWLLRCAVCKSTGDMMIGGA
jgi:hypothetical protein